jgi:TOBE domain-containing protein
MHDAFSEKQTARPGRGSCAWGCDGACRRSVGDNLIESVITRRSAEELKLKKGDTVAAVVKATEVMIQKD